MRKLFLLAVIALITPNFYNLLIAQSVTGQDFDKDQMNAIITGVPFLMIAPDSRSGAMGDVGVASTPGIESQHWNSSKYAFIDGKSGINISYTPWLRKLVDDINLPYVAGFYRLDDNQVIGGSLKYFSLGSIQFRDKDGLPLEKYSPNEFSIDASYNRKLSKNFSLGLAGRFIYSNLTGNSIAESMPAKTGAIDINGYYTNTVKVSGYNSSYSFGFNLSNIGAKISYSNSDLKNFIPTNLRIGGEYKIDVDDYNSIALNVDINKLMVPTPPVYYEKGDILPNGDTLKVFKREKDYIKAGMWNDVDVVQGILQSFYDAPGGAKEEFRELTYGVGIEYWYAKQFAVRGGYFHENEFKGNRKYFTLGLGLKMNVFGLDFAYLIPRGDFQNNALADTWRFSLVFNFDNLN